MKIKSGFVLSEISGKPVIIAVGKMAKEFNGMINLNPTSAFVWKLLEKGASEEDLVSALTAEFDVSEDVARQEIKSFIQKLKEAKLIKE